MPKKEKPSAVAPAAVSRDAAARAIVAVAREVRDDIAGKREIYYNSKSWGECRFDEQPESDALLDDIEAMLGVNREQQAFAKHGLNFVLERYRPEKLKKGQFLP